MPEQKKKATPESTKVESPKIPNVNREVIPRISLSNTLIILQEMKVRAFYLIIVVFGIKAFIYGHQNFRVVNLRITIFVR